MLLIAQHWCPKPSKILDHFLKTIFGNYLKKFLQSFSQTYEFYSNYFPNLWFKQIISQRTSLDQNNHKQLTISATNDHAHLRTRDSNFFLQRFVLSKFEFSVWMWVRSNFRNGLPLCIISLHGPEIPQPCFDKSVQRTCWARSAWRDQWPCLFFPWIIIVEGRHKSMGLH